MRMGWIRHDDIFVAPQALIDFAWSAPMRDLAKRVGISDVGLKKLLHGSDIVTPPQGHWNRVHAGKATTSPPKALGRRPGQSGRIRLDKRFKAIVPEAEPMPVGGPFASREVPEDLSELYEKELKTIGRVAAPRDLDRRHPGLVQLLKREDTLREKAARDRWYWQSPDFDTPLGQRKLRLINALFFALSGRGHSGLATNDGRELNPRAYVGDMTLSLDLTILGKHRTEMIANYRRPARDLPASTPLRLAVSRSLRAEIRTCWEDDSSGPLEKKLAAIAAGIIVAGEAAFRQSLVEEIERQQRAREREAEERQRRLEQLQAERLDHLAKSAEMLASAERIRTLIAHVKAAASAGRAAVTPEEFSEWEAWASAYADSLDPLLSGQMFTHIRAPRLGD